MAAAAVAEGHRFRVEDPHLLLTDDAADEDHLSGWTTDEDADTLAALTAEYGALHLGEQGGEDLLPGAERTFRSSSPRASGPTWPGALRR
ncbi:hypothetical protein [Streptomyces sp. NBC_01207]|uniref:hypothetical protein n=1 Tax=Streptomyces sp. NBC_01207 TaxID=2903772 RepID=UPI002E1417D0|nr:hypothetical protein OG457_46170 [Streptomyces sp. NBC_01207]